MLYHPDLIVYLWLLPVVLLIIMPVLFKTGCMFFRMTTRGQAACEKEPVQPNNTADQMERRKSPRVKVIGVVAQVRGADDYCTAMVTDVSTFGLCLKNIPQALLDGAKKFKVIVNTHVDNFEMMIYPRWEKVLESGYLVGAEIENAPRGWNEYIAKMDRITGGSTTTSL